MSTYTDAEFEMAFRLHTRLCYVFGAAFLIAAVADVFRGTAFFHWLLAHFGG